VVYVERRLQFWDRVKDKYKVDMSALKPFAVKCLSDHVHVHAVNAEDVMSRPTEICTYSLSSLTTSQLLQIKVSHSYRLRNYHISVVCSLGICQLNFDMSVF